MELSFCNGTVKDLPLRENAGKKKKLWADVKFPFKKTQTVHLANSPSKYSLPLPTLSPAPSLCKASTNQNLTTVKNTGER